jgi:hypothetical protein
MAENDLIIVEVGPGLFFFSPFGLGIIKGGLNRGNIR